MIFASVGLSSRNSISLLDTTSCTIGCTSLETSLSFVCDENFGSGTFTVADGGTFRIDGNASIGSGLTVQFGTYAGAGATWSNTSGATATIEGTANLQRGTVSANLSTYGGATIKTENNNGLVALSGNVELSVDAELVGTVQPA